MGRSNLEVKLDALLTAYYSVNVCFDFGIPQYCDKAIEWLHRAYKMGAIPYDLYQAIKQLIITVRESNDEKIMEETNHEFEKAIAQLFGVML